MIEIRNLCAGYGEKRVYENFNLDIEEGKITCVLGESGCGKTTFLNVLAGLLPHSGKVPKIKSSYVFQTPRLVPSLTVKGNLRLVCDDEEKINGMLGLVNLNDKSDRYPASLSGGEAQRVSICRAFAFPSDVLLMDEPFVSLDLKLKISIMEQFKKLQSADGRTTLFVTHDVDEALFLSDRIALLGDGKILWESENKNKCSFGEHNPLRSELISKLLQEN